MITSNQQRVDNGWDDAGEGRSGEAAVRPFRIVTPQEELDHLKGRLEQTRWPAPLPGEGWSRGVPVDDLRELAEYWRDGYDWRVHEARLNQFPQFMTEIDGLDVHFLHVRSPEPGALPLILTHGWPTSVVDFMKIIGPLTNPRAHGDGSEQAFHIVAPSVPGFAFSEPPRKTGWSVKRVAVMWAKLMARLGYDRYGAQGGDFGAYVVPELARIDAEHMVGVYINGGLGFPTEEDVSALCPAEQAEFAEMMAYMDGQSLDHMALMASRPQTFSYGWVDSPAALLALMMEKYQDYSMVERPEEVLDRDDMLTNITLYWLTGTIGTSSWIYYDNNGPAWPEGQSLVPTGLYSGGPKWMCRIAERDSNIVHWPEDNPGGHLPTMEVPERFVQDIRMFFDKLRLR